MAKLWSELILLFVVIPFAVLYWIKHFANYLMPILGVMGLCCLAILLADKQFKRIKLWHWEDYHTHLKSTLRLFLPWASLLALVVYFFKPELFLHWPMNPVSYTHL
ncbi:CPBP family intramembrane metalloprotease, partial [Alteromonas sp. MCA-1]|nr:CPBP family intramembrane metalloprotease [Alteromonas sp. MCA-1]